MNKLPDGWTELKLDQVISALENGTRPKGGVSGIISGIPSIGGEHISSSGSFDFSNVRYVSPDFFEQMKRGKIEPNDVLIVKDGATTGRVTIVRNDFPFSKAAVNEHVFILRPNQKVIPGYLFYFLYSSVGKRQILSNFHGSAQGGINSTFVNNCAIPIPPLGTQKKIVALLEKAEKLIELRENADKLTDEYLKAVFYEMFGDPIKNTKNLPKKKLSEFGKWHSGGTPSRTNTTYFEGTIPWYSSGELNSLFISNSMEKITEKALKESAAKLVPPNSLLLGMYDTAALKSSITTIQCSCNQAIAFSELEKKNVNIFYVYFAIQLGRKFFMSKQRGVRQKNLNLSMINNIEIPYPPLEHQNNFSQLVQKVEKLKQFHNDSKIHIDKFLNSLMQLTFRYHLNW